MNFMGIDIGTTSVKTAVFNEKLEELISLSADYTLDAHGDVVEFDGEQYFEIVRGFIARKDFLGFLNGFHKTKSLSWC